MKRTSLILLIVLALLLAACASPATSATTSLQTTSVTTVPTTATAATTTTAPTTTATATPTTVAMTTAAATTIGSPIGTLSVSSNAQTVRLTLPAAIFALGNTSKAEIEKSARENGVSEVIFNLDETVTYVMSRSVYQKMLDEMKKSIDKSINEMLADPDTSFKSITYNPAMTEFVVKVDAAKYSAMESMSALVFYITGSMYQTFSGVDPKAAKVVVQFVDNATGKVLETGDSSKIGK